MSSDSYQKWHNIEDWDDDGMFGSYIFVGKDLLLLEQVTGDVGVSTW